MGRDQFVQMLQHPTPRRQIARSACADQVEEEREALRRRRHLVRIDELERLGPLAQKPVDEGGLPGPVRTGEEDEGGHELSVKKLRALRHSRTHRAVEKHGMVALV